MSSVQLFLSAVSVDFRSYRDTLRRALARPNVTVMVQEEFTASGSPTLDKLSCEPAYPAEWPEPRAAPLYR